MQIICVTRAKKHHFPLSCALPAALQWGKENSSLLLPGSEWVHLFLEDRERRVKGLERERRNQMQPGTSALCRGRSAGGRFFCSTGSVLMDFGGVGEAEKGFV